MTLFNEPEVPTVDETPSEEVLAELVGEGKKFKTAADLAKGKKESDAFISQLQRETAELREELNKRLTVEELMTKINESRTAEPPIPPVNNQPPVVEPPKTEDVSSLISKELERRERTQAEDTNRALVRSTLITAFGGTYLQELRRRAADLGLSESEADQLAAAKPKAFLKAIGIDGVVKDTVFAPRSTQNTTSTPVTSNEKSYAFYQELRKSNPKLYYEGKTQLEMFEQAKKLGDDFYKP